MMPLEERVSRESTCGEFMFMAPELQIHKSLLGGAIEK